MKVIFEDFTQGYIVSEFENMNILSYKLIS